MQSTRDKKILVHPKSEIIFLKLLIFPIRTVNNKKIYIGILCEIISVCMKKFSPNIKNVKKMYYIL